MASYRYPKHRVPSQTADQLRDSILASIAYCGLPALGFSVVVNEIFWLGETLIVSALPPTLLSVARLCAGRTSWLLVEPSFQVRVIFIASPSAPAVVVFR